MLGLVHLRLARGAGSAQGFAMDMVNPPVRPATHFDFGRNWAAFADQLPEGAIERASQGLERLGLTALAGKTFLDIGCGSGVHAVAAMKKGAIVSGIDVDRVCVETANAMARRADTPVFAKQCSILSPSIQDLGTFDVVYSWGVLHHTGAVWDAIDAAASLVAKNGTLAIALYERTPLCSAWAVEKQLYTKAPPFARAMIRGPFSVARLLASSIRQRRSPVGILRDYKGDRGMDFWRDADDWLGGYPYQPTRAAEVIAFVEQRGFRSVRTRIVRPNIGVFGTGCSEFVFSAE